MTGVMTAATKVVHDYNVALAAHISNMPALRRALAEFITDQTVCVEPASAPWGGTWVGLDGFMTMFSTGDDILETDGTGAPFDPAQDEYVTMGDIVIRRYVLDVPATDASPGVNMPCLERYEVVAGKIAHIEVFFFDAARLSALSGG